jgi:predicted dehydrogenase
MSETIRWGIIGCGDVCEVKSGPGFAKAAGSALSVVMRRDGAKARDFAERHGVPRWTEDARSVIEGDDVDAVYIATPVDTHASYALAVAAAGKPCYVEKPMARNQAECQRMVEAFEEAGVPLFVAYYRRALPRFVEARRLIGSGHLGQIVGVSLRYTEPRHRQAPRDPLPWRLVAGRSGGGIFFDLGSHMLDAVDFLLGPLTNVQGAARNLASAYDVEDTVAMRFEIGDGVPGLGYWCFSADQRDDRIVIDGTKGRISLQAFTGSELVMASATDRRRVDHPDPTHIQQPLIQRGKGEAASTGASAARTAAVMDAVTAGYYGGRDDAFWDRPESWPGRPQRSTPDA